MTDRVDLQEFLGGFIAESDQLVAAAVAGLLEIDKANAAGETRPKVVRDLFRALHTLKGLAGMMAIEPIVEIAHAFETVVRAADQGGGKLGPRAVEVGLTAVRAISERVRSVADGKPAARAAESLLDELARVDHGGSAGPAVAQVAADWDRRLSEAERRQAAGAVEAGRTLYALTFAPSSQSAERGITIATVRVALAKLGEIVKVVPRTVGASDSAPAGLVFDILVISDADRTQLAEAAATTTDHVTQVAAEPAPAPVAAAELPALDADAIGPIGRSFVRVELARLDELQEQLSALVVSRFRLERQIAALAAAGTDVRALREVAELQARQLRDLRRGILRARMVRVAEVLEPLWLVVRSLTKPGVREARLELDTRDVELDKAVADRLLPAIVHLVRNAIDHAIEPVAERERAGKPRVGVIRIECREAGGNQVELAVSDDGRGIDRERVARKLGRPLADASALLDALATPGFSTREVATETSGRGLGVDIARRAVAGELGGELELATALGVGTTFTLRVPLTIAIIDVFALECASQLFVVPVSIVEEIFELADHARMDGPSDARDRLPVALCNLRGKALPVVSLGGLLRLSRGEPAGKALVVRRNGEPVAFTVDRMIGRHEVVVRPIEDALVRAPGIAGATDLGDGRPTLLLDLVELGARIDHWRAEAQA